MVGAHVPSYRITRRTDIAAELRRIALHQLDGAISAVDHGPPDEAVHELRRRVKKVRAVLRLVRPVAGEVHDRENVALRDASRRVASARDVSARLDAFDGLAADLAGALDLDAGDERLDLVRDGLVADLALPTAVVADLASASEAVAAVRTRVGGWDLGDVPGLALLAPGLARTYERCRRGAAAAADDPTSDDLHAWRKRVKDHRYQLSLLLDLWPELLTAERDLLHDLSDRLGDDHDLAVLRAHLHDAPVAYGGDELVAVVTGQLDHRRAQLQGQARVLGARAFAEPTDAFVARITAYWDAWEVDVDPSELADPAVPSGR